MKRRTFVLVFSLALNLSSIALSHAQEQLICCGEDEVFILPIEDGSLVSKPVWSWKAEDSPEIPAAARKTFASTDDCKPVGEFLLVTSSSGGVALVRRSDKTCHFYTQAKNAHSACLLPDYRLAVASSFGGDELLIYEIQKPNGKPAPPAAKIALKGAHGTVWDKQRNRLWALGSDELLFVDIGNSREDTSLNVEQRIKLPTPGGHELSPSREEAVLFVSTNERVYRFDKNSRQFIPDPRLADQPRVKSISQHPATGEIVYHQGAPTTWWSDTIRFPGTRKPVQLAGRRLYKIRWDIGQAKSSPAVEFVVGEFMPAESNDGKWKAEDSPLSSPFGVDFDSRNNMFIVELGGGRVHKLTTSGQLKHVGGDGSKSYLGDGGPLAKATFNGMHNCAITPTDDLYIADSWNHCIRKVDAGTGVISTFAGTGEAGYSGDGGPAADATFNFIMCITLNRAGDQLYVADLKNRRIRAIDLATGIVRTVAGNGRTGVPADGSLAVDSPLADPRAVTVDSNGLVYVLERGGQALRVVDSAGRIRTVAGTGKRGHNDGPALEATFGSPKHVCVDDHDNVFIADDQNKAIRKYDPDSQTVSTVLGRKHGDPRIQLSRPHGVTWHHDCLYVLDTGHNRILKLRP